MPRLANGAPASAKTPTIIPVQDFPWMRKLMTEIDYECKECTTRNQDIPVYHTLEDSNLSPIACVPLPSGRPAITAKGMFATYFLVMCPETQYVPVNSPLFENGRCDLTRFPHDFKKPLRKGGAISGVSYDEEDEAPVAPRAGKQAKKFGSSRLHKTTDLAPATTPPKPKKLTKKEQALVAAAMESNRKPVGSAGLHR